MKTIAAITTLFLAVSLMPTATHGAPKKKDEELTPEERLAVDLADLGKDLGRRHVKLSRWCKGKKLRRAAHRHLLLAIRFDPQERSARLGLGYKKVDGAWVLRKPVDLEKLEDGDEGADEYQTRDVEIRTVRVRGLLEIAATARAGGLADRADALLREAMLIAPGETAVRSALGHRQIAGRWFAPEVAAALPEPITVDALPGPSAIAKGLGLQLTGWRSGRFQLEGGASQGEFEMVLAAGRRADGLLGWILDGQPNGTLPRLSMVHCLGQQTAFERYVDGMSGLADAAKAVAKRTGLASAGGRVVRIQGLAGAATGCADWLTHGIVRDWLQARLSRRMPAWLLSGLSDHVSNQIVGTMITRFFTVEASAGVQFSAGKGAAATWRRQLRDLALLGEDPGSGTLFSSSITGLTSADILKAWSIVEYLLDRDPAAFRVFVTRIGEGGSVTALRKAYALTPEALDEAWREWVIRHG